MASPLTDAPTPGMLPLARCTVSLLSISPTACSQCSHTARFLAGLAAVPVAYTASCSDPLMQHIWTVTAHGLRWTTLQQN